MDDGVLAAGFLLIGLIVFVAIKLRDANEKINVGLWESTHSKEL